MRHQELPTGRFEHGRAVVRTGRLLTDRAYMTLIVPGGKDVDMVATVGSLVEWCGDATEHRPILRGDTHERVRYLHVYVPQWCNTPIGVGEHEVEWDDDVQR